MPQQVVLWVSKLHKLNSTYLNPGVGLFLNILVPLSVAFVLFILRDLVKCSYVTYEQ